MRSSCRSTRPLLLAVACSLAIGSAQAASRRDQAVAALDARMAQAEQRWRQASAQGGDTTAEAGAALAEMQAVVAACAKLRGCNVQRMTGVFARLLTDPGAGEAVDDAATNPVPEAARAAALLSEGQRFDRMVEFNPAVQHGIRRWLTDMRGALMNSYENYQNMRHLMWPQFERAGLPEALLFGILAKESNGRVHAVSPAGAAGPMQFMPATGRRFGLGDDGSGFDTRYDARAAAMASAEYLNERMRQLNRNIELSLAGYNGGEGRAARVHRESGGRSFWDASVYEQFPAETRDYVPMVIAAAWLFLHADEYGITWPKVEAKPAMLRLSQPASIYQLTICLGNGSTRDGYMRALRNLNPRWDADEMLPAGTPLQVTAPIATRYARYCTTGPRAELARTLVASDASRAIVRRPAAEPTPPAVAEATPSPAPVQAVTPKRRDYRVQAGETLTSIARKFGCRVGELARANDLDRPGHVLRPGQLLDVGGCSG